MITEDLKEFIDSVDDITDPYCMQQLMIYVEQKHIEDEDFMLLLIERLNDMTITWEQPWYQQTNCLTRPLKEVEKDGISYLTGHITKEESDLIHKNWCRLRKKYDLPNTPICIARWKNKFKSKSPSTPEERARQYVTAYLARGLQRQLYQVYRHIFIRYGQLKTGYYSDIEEKIMDICFHHCPKNAVTYLSAILARDPRGIYKRLFQMFNGKPEKKRINWTLELASKFIRLLLQHTEESLDNIKNKNIDKSVWVKLQDDFDQSYPYLRMFWLTTLHSQLFVKCDVKLKRLRKKILKILMSSPYKRWSDINWKALMKYFPDGFTPVFLYRVTYNWVYRYPGGVLNAPLDSLIEYGLERIKDHRKRRLRTLIFQDGNLEAVKHAEKMAVIDEKLGP